MPTLLQKIESNAALRLTLPPGQEPSKDLARYKNFIKIETHRLRILHRGGEDGKTICAGRSAMMDALIRSISEAVLAHPKWKGTKLPRVALVAIGGYGRTELNPHSDIDIMFLHDGGAVQRGKPTPFMSALSDGLLYTLWDVGLKVGHSVRSLAECVQVANSDLQSKTSLIQARLISGDESLFKKLQETVESRCIKGHEAAYIEARIKDQTARRTKYGNSASLQEPNIKNGCGGLRDYQNLLWMALFKYRSGSLADLEAKELINPSETKQLDNAYDFLLRVRNELHYQVNRPVDVLTRNVQPAVAHGLGYTDRSPRIRLERFMKDLYHHLRNLYLITKTLELRLALAPQLPPRMPFLKGLLARRPASPKELQVLDGFNLSLTTLSPASPRVFRDQPRRMMRMFLHLQQRGLTLSPDLAQMVRNQLSLVDRSFIRDEHAQQTFLQILSHRGNVAPILRAMHEVGFLGKYIPEFGKLTCLVQHEFYHQYTADEHTLVCIEKLETVWEAKEYPLAQYADIFRNLEQPNLLYLALLLHDSGKAYPDSSHTELGGAIALNVARRLGLDGASAHTLQVVIENHLIMAQISQRRDLEDPAVIKNFAEIVQTSENLDILTLHTLADSMGTSDQLWNGFKDSLLLTLHAKTREFLTAGPVTAKLEEKQRELLTAEVLRLKPRSFSRDELEAHFDLLPPRYFRVNSPEEIVGDLSQAHRFMHYQLGDEDRALEPVVSWHIERDRGYSVAKICTWDRAGLFSKIAGSFTAAGINILSAQIFTRGDGIILDTFCITDARTGAPVSKEEREEFEKVLGKALIGDVDFQLLFAKRKYSAPRYAPVEEDRIETVIRVDNLTSESATLIEIETEDRIGLLYVVSSELSSLGLDISVAKICTEKGAAIDTFYIVQPVTKTKITDAEQLRHAQDRLRAAILSLH